MTKVTHASLSADGAEQLCAELNEYHAALAAGPLAVADLVGADVLKRDDGYHVRHVMELVEGDPLSRLPYEERLVATRSLAHDIQAMPSRSGSQTALATPIDAKPRNWQVHNSRPVLVDICPPFVWGDRDMVRTPLIPDSDRGTRLATTAVVGYRSGVLSELLMAAVPDRKPDEAATTHALRVFNTAPSWSADLIPASLSPVAREDLAVRLYTKLAALAVTAQRAQ